MYKIGDKVKLLGTKYWNIWALARVGKVATVAYINSHFMVVSIDNCELTFRLNRHGHTRGIRKVNHQLQFSFMNESLTE